MSNANSVTNNNPALQSLHDIALPENITSWPVAPGWWILGIILLSITFFISRFAWKKHQAIQQRKEFILNIENAEKTLKSIPDDQIFKQQALILIQQILQLISQDVTGKTGDTLQQQLNRWIKPEDADFLTYQRYKKQLGTIDRAHYLNIIEQLNAIIFSKESSPIHLGNKENNPYTPRAKINIGSLSNE